MKAIRQKQWTVEPELGLLLNIKSYAIYRTVSFPVIWSDP